MTEADSDPTASVPIIRVRNQNAARRVIDQAFPFQCCAVCGMQIATCLQIAHLDHDAVNNAADNLVRLCPTHHWMYDVGFYPIEAIRLLQAHWQATRVGQTISLG